METTTISGATYAAPANTSHVTPDDIVIPGTMASEAQQNYNTGMFKNTGNVAQTVTVVASAVGVTVDQSTFASTGTATRTFQPGEEEAMNVVFTTPATTIGGADEPFTITLDATWS